MSQVIRIRTASAVLPRRGVGHHAPEKNNGLKPKLQTVVFIAAEEETCPPARPRSLSRRSALPTRGGPSVPDRDGRPF
jgi:hypothetical protein